MKSVTIVKRFRDFNNTNEITSFCDVEFLRNNNYISKITVAPNTDWYVLGSNITGDNRLTPLSYISKELDSFQFLLDDDTTITISFNTFVRVYTQAEANLQNQYAVGEQSKIGIDYLISVYNSQDWGD